MTPASTESTAQTPNTTGSWDVAAAGFAVAQKAIVRMSILFQIKFANRLARIGVAP
jgi:hypothetical protein